MSNDVDPISEEVGNSLDGQVKTYLSAEIHLTVQFEIISNIFIFIP